MTCTTALYPIPAEDLLASSWVDRSDLGLTDVRVFQRGALVAVLARRESLWDPVLTDGPNAPQLGVLRPEEIGPACSAGSAS